MLVYHPFIVCTIAAIVTFHRLMVVRLADSVTGATTLPGSTVSFSITCLEIEVNSHLLKKIAQSNAALELSPGRKY